MLAALMVRVAAAVEVRVLQNLSAGTTYPTDLAADARANAYVVDGLNKRVVVLSPQGQVLREITHEAFVNPVGNDVWQDRLYVSDPEAGAIFIMTLDGRLLQTIEMPGNCDPVDVLALEDKLVVSDNDNHRLLFISYDGALLKAIGRGAEQVRPMRRMAGMTLPDGRPGDRVEEFKFPGILSRHQNGFMVIDVLGGRIQAYTRLGNFDRMVGSFGTDGDRLYRPKGACACWNGKGLLITDSYMGMVHAYDEFAQSQGLLTLKGQPWRLEGPTAIVCCGESWWIVDSKASRILRFDIP
ncbi:MAG: hypothetical protein Q8O14_08610 [bacterium]|nr:hypothetical protein [bacterium]